MFISLYNLTSTPNFHPIAPKTLQTTISVGLKSTLIRCYTQELTWQLFMISNKTSFYVEGLLTPRPNPKLEDRPLSALRDCLFNTSAAPLYIGGHSSIRNMRTHITVVTGPTHDIHFHNTSLLPPWLFFESLILKKEALHPSKLRSSNTAVRISCFRSGEMCLTRNLHNL